MASTIAAITTGIGGIVTTADATGNLSLLSGTSTVVAVTSAGAAVTGTMSVSGATTLTGGLNTPLAVTSGGTGVTTKTGTGAVVLGTSPTLTTPVINSATVATVSGTAPLYMCRAWATFVSTTGAILSSGNVTSVTRNSAGNYTITMTTAMADANYVVTTIGGSASGTLGVVYPHFNGATYTAPTTTVFRLTCQNLSAVAFDSTASVGFAVFG